MEWKFGFPFFPVCTGSPYRNFFENIHHLFISQILTTPTKNNCSPRVPPLCSPEHLNGREEDVDDIRSEQLPDMADSETACEALTEELQQLQVKWKCSDMQTLPSPASCAILHLGGCFHFINSEKYCIYEHYYACLMLDLGYDLGNNSVDCGVVR